MNTLADSCHTRIAPRDLAARYRTTVVRRSRRVRTSQTDSGLIRIHCLTDRASFTELTRFSPLYLPSSALPSCSQPTLWSTSTSLRTGVAFYNVLVRVIRYSRVDPRPLRHTPAPPASVGHVKGRWLSRLHVQGHLSHAGAEILEDTSPEPVSSTSKACRDHSSVNTRCVGHVCSRCEQHSVSCVYPLRRPAKNIHCATTMACVSIRRAS